MATYERRLVMAGTFPVTGEQYRTIDRRMRDIIRQLDRPNGSPLDPAFVTTALQYITEGRRCEHDLIHGMFASPDAQLRMAKQRNLERGWGFTDEDFAALCPAPPWPTNNCLAVVILDISLDTVEHTFEEGWLAAKSVQQQKIRLPELKSDKKSLRLLSGNHERGFRWQVVDLGANMNRQPNYVRNPATSPSSSILWMAFYSPKWIQAMNGTDVPNVWIPGYEVTIPGIEDWECAPLLDWRGSYPAVELNACFSGLCISSWAVPVIRPASV